MRSASSEGFFQHSQFSTINLAQQPIKVFQNTLIEQRQNQQRVPQYEKYQAQNQQQSYRIVSNSIDSKQELLKNSQNIHDSLFKHKLNYERNIPQIASLKITDITNNSNVANNPTIELGQETSESFFQIVDQIETNESFQQGNSKRSPAKCTEAILQEIEELKKQLFSSESINLSKQKLSIADINQRANSISGDSKSNQIPQYFRTRQNNATHYPQSQSTESVYALCQQFPSSIQLAQEQQQQKQLQPFNSNQNKVNNQQQACISMDNVRLKSHSFNVTATDSKSQSSSFAQRSTTKSSYESNPTPSNLFNISSKTFYDPSALQKKLDLNKLSNYNYNNLLKEELPVFCVNCERYVQLACLEQHSKECLNTENSQIQKKGKEKNANEELYERFEQINDHLIRIELQIIKRLEKAKDQQEQSLRYALKVSQSVRQIYELERLEQSLIELKQQRALLSIDSISELILYDRLILLFWQKITALGCKQPKLLPKEQQTTFECKKYLNCCESDQKYKVTYESRSTLKNKFQSYSEKKNKQSVLNIQNRNIAQSVWNPQFSSNFAQKNIFV